MDSLHLYDSLPPVSDIPVLSLSQLFSIRDNIAEHRNYCSLEFAREYNKFFDWCTHLKCFDEDEPCNLSDSEIEAAKLVYCVSRISLYLAYLRIVPLCSVDMLRSSEAKKTYDVAGSTDIINSSVSLSTKTTPGTWTTTNASVTHAISEYASLISTSTLATEKIVSGEKPHPVFDLMQYIGYNGTKCYDDHLCDQPQTAQLKHSLLGVICFLLCLFGTVTNPLLLPAFNTRANRSGATLYLTGMGVCDTIYLLVTTFAVVLRHIPAAFPDQMEMYARISGYLVPTGLPIMLFCELTVVRNVLSSQLLFFSYQDYVSRPLFYLIFDIYLSKSTLL
ncbi:unnamed protein product [Protopolystoma xenopodis]|uniref:Uncharacterized protein n=1 Tax=Protopolystoma xenopodis TaxID=117903 RepID=A0A3S5A1D1_9PLAT|nr:unnamed protein product [Protopolystoma xenopodis]